VTSYHYTTKPSVPMNVCHQSTSENLVEDDQSSSVEKSVIKTDERKDYNLKVLKYVQCIFAHLAGSKLQFYVPKGFWKHFRLVCRCSLLL